MTDPQYVRSVMILHCVSIVITLGRDRIAWMATLRYRAIHQPRIHAIHQLDYTFTKEKHCAAEASDEKPEVLQHVDVSHERVSNTTEEEKFVYAVNLDSMTLIRVPVEYDNTSVTEEELLRWMMTLR